MKACIVAEGCYPYVVGGVSSWIQMIMEGIPEADFTIYTIAVDESQRGMYKYEPPKNLKVIRENFLMDKIAPSSRRRGNGRIPKADAQALELLVLSDKDTPWRRAYEIVNDEEFRVYEYLHGYDFYDAALRRYERDQISVGFSEYLWTLRSMFQPLLAIFRNSIPEADLYHSVSAGYAGIIGALGSQLYGKPFLLSEHGIYTREREEELIRSQWTKGYFKGMWIDHFYAMSHFAYNQAHAVVSLFDKNADIEVELGCPREKIRIIPNGVAVSSFENLPEPPREEGILNVGAVVRVTPIKDIKTMILAFHQVKQKVANTKFYIMGPTDEDEEYYAECLDLLKTLGTQDVIFTGRVNVKEYVTRMDVMVLTSISEGQPLAVLEGMAMRKPWVTTNVGSCHQLLYGSGAEDPGQAGIAVPVMDAQKIADATVKLLRDERMRLDMSRVGYRRVMEHYQQSFMFDKYRELYEEMGGPLSAERPADTEFPGMPLPVMSAAEV